MTYRYQFFFSCYREFERYNFSFRRPALIWCKNGKFIVPGFSKRPSNRLLYIFEFFISKSFLSEYYVFIAFFPSGNITDVTIFEKIGRQLDPTCPVKVFWSEIVPKIICQLCRKSLLHIFCFVGERKGQNGLSVNYSKKRMFV